MASIGKITRRGLLGVLGLAVGGAAFGFWYGSRPWDNPLQAQDGDAVFNPWLTIKSDNTITVHAPRAEMGQGVHTTLAALVAEELNTPLDKITVVQAPASGAYYNSAMLEEGGPFAFWDESTLAQTVASAAGWMGKALGLQGTGGSSTIRDAFDKMRMAGAVARESLIGAAAARLNVPRNELAAADGQVTHKVSGTVLSFGDLAADAARTQPENVGLKDRKDWTILGKPQKRTDMTAKITGQPVYGIDVSLPDMIHGTVLMAPAVGSKIKSLNDQASRAVKGVIDIVPLDTLTGNGFGILASNTWAAFKAASLLDVEWDEPANAFDSSTVEATLKAGLESTDYFSLRDDGDVDTAFADAPQADLIEADYSVPFLAHAAMEPMNATAQFVDGKVTLWLPDQVPTLTKLSVSKALGLTMDDVTVNTTMLGGAFGRRLETDYAVYAALLAKAANGKPVKVTWTREEDFTHDFYRPAAVARLKAKIGKDGVPEAFSLKIASPSIIRSVMARTLPSLFPAGPDKLIVTGSFDQPYEIANYRVSGVEVSTPVPVGMWRSVGNSINGFFHECALDEIASKGGIDPIDLRLKLAAGFPYVVKVIEAVRDLSNWQEPAVAGRAKGFAFCHSFGSWVAMVVEVSDANTGIRIENVWIAADPGIALDPAIVEAQLMSGAIYGLSAALMQQITFRKSRAEQVNFPDHDALRMANCPRIHMQILENAPKLGGVGEIATPPAAPALANAIARLTGKRVRRLPISAHLNDA